MRTDHDALGEMLIDDDIYYGIHTERARQNFDVSGVAIGDFPHYLSALANVKKAAALANLDAGLLRPTVAHAICQAADEIIAGRFDRRQFPVDVMCGGGGTSPNMNVNEILANRANEILTGHKGYEIVHPNNHVNIGQSTTDVIATAINLALHQEMIGLIDSVRLLEHTLSDKIAEHRDTVKLARTCLQDAVPITFGQEFGAYLAAISRGVERLSTAADACLEVPMGATVVGTGLGVGAGYSAHVYTRLAEVTGLPVRRHPNFFDCIQNGDIFQHISATFKALGTNLAKMSRDLTLLSSGTRSGLMEITLPAVQAGSSFIPGKINPVMPELVSQVAFQITGNDAVITTAVQSAELDFNTWTAVIAKNLFESCQLLTRSIPLFATRCVKGIEVRADHCRHSAESSLALSSVLATIYGYEAGASAAAYARDHDCTIRQAAIELNIMSAETADELLDPVMLTDARRSATILDQLVEERRTRAQRLIADLPAEVRTCLLESVVAVARADGHIGQEEILALEVIADTLQLTLTSLPDTTVGASTPTLPTGMATLPRRDRELIFSSALWVAMADKEDPRETVILQQLQARLELDPETTHALRAAITEMFRNRRQFVPKSEILPWWEDFAGLITRLSASSSDDRTNSGKTA